LKKFEKHFLKPMKDILFTGNGMMLKEHGFRVFEMRLNRNIKSHFHVTNIYL